jgi:2'-5' RNA ligase
MDEKRVFIAIDISKAARGSVTEHISKLRELYPNIRARWVGAANLHITMRFVGNVDPIGLKELDERVRITANAFEQFQLTLAETGNFGRRRDRTDTLWIGVKAGETLEQIASALEDAPSRKFVPHLTIARIKDARDAGPLIEVHLSSHLDPINFIVRELVIYESTLTPSGSVYSVLSRHALKAA